MSRLHDALKRAQRERPANREEFNATSGSLGSPTESRAAAGAPAIEWQAEDVSNCAGRFVRVHWNPDPRKLLTYSPTQIPAVEAFRALRSQLYHLRSKRPLKTVLVASALANDGKSFVSANLAAILARQDNTRVLLVDGDLRFPRLYLTMGTRNEPGLAEYLQNQADESTAIQTAQIHNLFFLPAGKQAVNSGELITSTRFPEFIRRASDDFDWIVIDSSAALPISDARVMSETCDGVLIVVAHGATPCREAQKIARLFGQKVLGAVINRVPMSLSYSSYYYGRAK